ncbi:MAG: hypothetical protein U0R80_09285 [Nocardioidaceae bacterium]
MTPSTTRRLVLIGVLGALLVGAVAAALVFVGLPWGHPRVTALATAWNHTLVLDEDGQVSGTGTNTSGQLTGHDDPRRGLERLSGLPAEVRAVAVSAGWAHSLVLGDDGVVYGAGKNGSGELTGQGGRPTLTPLAGLPDGVRATAVAAGDKFSLVLGDDGVAYGAGRNDWGQLTGRTDTVRTLTPLAGLPEGVRAVEVAAGGGHSLVLGDDGRLYGSGSNDFGQLTGRGGFRFSLAPLAGLPAGVGAVHIATGCGQSLAIGDDGVAYGTGSNLVGQLTGENREVHRLAPLTGLPDGVRAAGLSGGCGDVLVLGDDGVPYGAGANDFGQLTGADPRATLAPLTGLPGDVLATQVLCGYSTEDGPYSLVLGDDGHAYATGSNRFGQYGDVGARHRTLVRFD